MFAFGLAELADLGTLEADAVRERIFSAGVVGRGRSAATAIAQLDKRAAALLTPSGRSGRIRELERELKLAEGALRAARGEAGTHARARADEEEARDAVVRLRAAGAAVAGEERRARRLVELWPMETARATLTAELAAIPHDPGIDDASEARLERALTQAAAAEEALRVRTAERDAAVGAHDAISCDDRLAAVAGEVRALARERAAHVERQERLAGLRAARASATGTLQDELARLGPGWDRGRLEAFDASIPTAGQVRGWGDRLARSDAEARQAAAVERERQAAAIAARRTLDEARARLAAAGGDDGLDGAEAALRALRSELPEQARREAAAVGAGGARPPLRAAALAAAGVLAVLAAVLAIGSDAVAAGVALVAAAVVAALGLLTPRDGGSAGAALARERGALHVAELATRAGVRLPVDALAVEERAARLAEVRALGAELARAAAAAREAERMAAESAAQAAATADEAEQALAGWAVEAARLGLPEAPSPDAATDAFTSVARAREALRTLAHAEQVLAAEEARAATFADRVRGALEAAGEVVAVDDVAAAVERLAELVEADARAREERARHARARDEAARRLREVEEAGAACAARLAVVLDGDDVEGFRARIARARRRAELARSLAEAERQLRATAGAGEDAARLLEELRSGALETWQADVARLSTRRVDLDRQREDAVRRHEKALARLGELEESADVATHDLACAALREERDRAVEAWQRLVIARGLVADTLARFERERQPAVLERAAEHFREVTAGRYERLAVRDGAVDAIDASGRRVDAAVLSRGTREQLYLCLRLGPRRRVLPRWREGAAAGARRRPGQLRPGAGAGPRAPSGSRRRGAPGAAPDVPPARRRPRGAGGAGCDRDRAGQDVADRALRRGRW